MDSARELFDKLVRFKQTSSSTKTTSQQFLEYCAQVLGTVERLHFDFKQKHDRSQPKLDDDDKRNFAKAISGFANSGGGVLIWGIEDRTLLPKPITYVQHFVSSLLELAPQVTDPTVPNIDGDWIPEDTRAGQEGYGLIFVPESNLPPHRVILNYGDIKNHYFIRSGNSFVVASHTMLEDMFGRRPKPVLALSMSIEPQGPTGGIYRFSVILGIENKGRWTAKSPFLSVNVHEPYNITDFGLDGYGHFGLRMLTKSSGFGGIRYGSSEGVVIHPGIIHDVTAVIVQVDEKTKREEVPDLVIDYKITAEGIRLVEEQAVIEGFKFFDLVNR